MKKTKIVSVILIIMIVASMIFTAKNVFAATDLTDSLTGSSSNNNTTDNNVVDNNTTGNNLVLNNTNTNNTTGNNTVLKTNNTSSYNNNTSLPKTGVADSMPVVMIAVVLGISGIYAYKKMQEYKNI